MKNSKLEYQMKFKIDLIVWKYTNSILVDVLKQRLK